MRVTQNQLYASFIANMNDTLAELVELNIKSSSQKNINRPSDDPVGMAEVLGLRRSLADISQYQDNISTAKGWLGLADDTMLEVSTVITRARELAEQAASGTYTAENREQISYEARELFAQLLSLANTTFDDKSIFAGHKVDGDAFREALMVNSTDPDMAPYLESVSGSSDSTVLVQFLNTADAVTGQDAIDYRYSKDGGDTWSTVKTLPASGAPLPPTVQLDLDGVQVNVRSGFTIEGGPGADNTKLSEGTWLRVEPTAVYQGDDENQVAVQMANDPSGSLKVRALGGFEQDVRIQVTSVGPGSRIDYNYTAGGTTYAFSSNSNVLKLPEGEIVLDGSVQAGLDFTVRSGASEVNNFGSRVGALAKGSFAQDVVVRLQTDTTIGAGGQLVYDYSTDGGATWRTGNTVPNPAGASEVQLVLPGGSLKLSSWTGAGGVTEDTLSAGQQFVVHRRTAAIKLDISQGESIQVNSIGKDIFGGYYAQGSAPVRQDEATKNLFVTMGKLVGALESNDQQGVQEALAALEDSQQTVLNAAASVGGRENRLALTEHMLSGLELDETDRMSSIEDVDITWLMTRLAQQEVAYQAVLKSTSSIMKMSLMNYI